MGGCQSRDAGTGLVSFSASEGRDVLLEGVHHGELHELLDGEERGVAAGGTVEELYSQVIGSLPNDMNDLVFVTYSSSAVDITPKGVDKASGLTFLSERTSIPFVEMLGIGDTKGDFPMLERVGFPACPSNAKPEVIELVQERNGHVAQKPNTAGVWEILLHYNLP